MKKIRILAVVLAVLMLPLALLFGCEEAVTNPCADGHNFPNKWERIQRRSCTLDEIEQRTCKKCGWIEQQVANAATGHVFDEANKISMNDATCTEDGHYVIECTWCTEVQITDYPGSALGHKFVKYVSQEDGYSELAYCVNCNAGTDEKLLGIKLDFEGDKSHLSYTAMDTFTGGNADLATYVTSNGSTALSIKRPAGGVVGSSAYGLVLSPRVDILENVQYVIEANLVLSGATGNVTITGNKAYGGQSMDFVTYDLANKSINVVGGPAYAVSASDLTAGVKVAIVTNDSKSVYDLYVNDVLVAASVEYIDDFYQGFGIGTFEIKMAEGDTASEIIIDNVLLYNAAKPNGWTGAANEFYDYYTTKTGENIVTLKLDAACDHDFDYKNVVINCSASSYTLKECSKCGGAAVTKEAAPASHKWAFSHATAASCWAPAYECNVCTVCGLKDGQITAPKLVHELGDNKTVVEPTCTDIGYSEGNCRNCGYFFYDASSEVPALGHEVGADATVVVPDCTTKGYTEGPCIRCGKTYRPEELNKSALGHTCFAPVIYPASCTEAGYTQNKCDACGEEYKTNEVSTTGHVNFSRVVGETIETVCVECGNSTVLKLVKVQPTAQEQIDYINANGTMCLEASLDTGFSSGGSLTSIGSMSAITRGNGKIQAIPRYSYWTLKEDAIRPGNKYWSVEYTPQNCTNADSVHSYMNIWNNKYSSLKGKRFIFEFSIKPNEHTFAAMTVQGLERFTKSPYTVNALEIKEDGTVTSRGAVCGKIDVNNTNVWTRIAVVADCTAHTYEVYFNGVLVSSAPIDNNPTSFPYVQEWRVNVGTQDKKRTESQGYDLDEVFSYCAQDPLYITGLNRYDGTLTNFTEAANNDATGTYLESIGASRLGYSGKEVWKVESMTDTFYGASEPSTKNVVKFVKGETGMPALNNIDADGNIISYAQKEDGAITATDTRAEVAWVNVGVKFPKVDGVKIDVVASQRLYTLSGEANIVSTDDPATEDVVEPTVYKKTYETAPFLTLDNGTLYLPDGREVCKVEANKWYNISLITREASGKITYEVYVNGMLYYSDLELIPVVPASSTLNGAYTLFMLPYTNCEYLLSDLAVYGNVTVPDVYVGKLEAEAEIERPDITILEFNANSKVEDYITWDDNSKGNKLNTVKTYDTTVLEEVVNEETGETEQVEKTVPVSYLEITDAEFDGIYAGYAITKVGLNRVVGDGAGEDAKWTLKVTDFVNNGAANYVVPKFGFDGIKANEDGTYDFSGYEKVVLRMFVEEHVGGGIQVRFRSAEGYAYASWTVNAFGWVTFEADISLLKLNGNPDLTKIEEVYIDTDAKAGNTFYIESIKVTQFPQYVTGSSYIAPDAPCEEHTFVAGTPVAPTCDNKGYTVSTCSVCGVKKADAFTDALGHKYVAEAPVTIATGCEAPSYVVTKNTCSVCQDVQYVSAGSKPTGHNWQVVTAGAATCTEDAYSVVKCANAGCEYAEMECRYVLKATGHAATAGTIVTVAPDCVNDGYTGAKCSVCGENYQYDIVPAIGHRIVEVKRDLAQCEVEGKIYNSCSNPGCTESADVVIPAKGHTYEESARVPAMNGVDGKITMTCINGCGSSYDVAITAFPTAAQMAAKNPIVAINGENKAINVGSFAGAGSGDGITTNFAKWSTKTDAANGSYFNVVVVPGNCGEGETVASNIAFDATGAKVIEFNVKPNGEAFADLALTVNVNGADKKLATIASTGWISFNGIATYQIDVAEDAWTRIAIVACDDATIDFYVNGNYARSMWLDANAVFGAATLAVGEGAKDDAGLCIDEIYALGELSFVTGDRLALDDAKIDVNSSKYFTNKDNTLSTTAFRDGVLKNAGVVYKNKFKVTLANVTDTFYGDDNESSMNVMHIEKNESFGNYGTEANKDSWITVQDLSTAKTVHLGVTLKFNKATSIAIFGCHRRNYTTGLTGNHETQNPLEFTGKKFKFFGKEVADAKIGEWYKLDVYYENFGSYKAMLFINDQLVYTFDTMPTKGAAHVYTDEHPVKAQFIRAFNVSNNANNHDIYVSNWDVNFDVKLPEA